MTSRTASIFDVMARFRTEKWPEEGAVRDFLSYLDDLREEAGRPSLSEMGRSVALAPSTLSGFFTGARLIGRGNLELLVEHLGGDVVQAERLRRKAVGAWHAPRPASRSAPSRPEPLDPTGRLEIVIYTTPVNKLNRPEQLLGRLPLIREVAGLLDSFSRVLLHGLGGSGKTALAATLADQRVEAGRGAYLWLRPGLADADVALDALGRALCAWDTAGFPEPVQQSAALSPLPARSPSPESSLAASCPPGPAAAGAGGGAHDADLLRLRAAVAASGVTLCVIDDAAQPAVLFALLRAMPDGLPVLVTSRRRLALEHQIEVAGLAAADAVRLLALHACAENVAAGPGAAALCADLGHHPYAIEIAGQHLRQYGGEAAELRAQLAGAPHELAVPGGFAPPGRESIRRLLDHTVSALDSADAVAVLRAFGAFRSAGATVELLAGYLEVGRARVEVALKSLVDLSLAKRMPGTSYYAIHDLTFAYARALDESKVESRAVAAARAFTAAHRDELDMLALELDNLLGVAALAGAAGNGVLVKSAAGLERTRFYFPFAPALWDSVVSVSGGGDAWHRAGYSNNGEVVMEGTTHVKREDGPVAEVLGSSFAAPRLSARVAVYLLTGGPSPCDGHLPVLGYTNSELDDQLWEDNWLERAANTYCTGFLDHTTLT